MGSPLSEDYFDSEERDGVRMPWNVIPRTKEDVSESVVPVSAIYKPFKPLLDSTYLLPYPPVRCRNCHSVLNPYCEIDKIADLYSNPPSKKGKPLINPFKCVDFRSKLWICSFCLTRNLFPNCYNPTSNPPVELCPKSTTVEYEADDVLCDLISVVPDVFLLVMDTCLSEEEFSYLRNNIELVIVDIPKKSLLGLITFGSNVILHELGHNDNKVYVFDGDKEISKDEVMNQLGFRDAPSQENINRFFLQASDCDFALSSVLRELHINSSPVPADERAPRSTGTALMVAAHLLEVCVPDSGARIMAFLGGPATEGPGSIVSKALSEPIRSHKDLLDKNAPFYHKAVEFYEGLAMQLVRQGHVLNVFACALDQVGVAELKVAIERTGGLTVLAKSFGHDVFRVSLVRIFHSGDNDDHLALSSNGVFEVNLSKDIQIQRVLGPCASHAKDDTTAWKMCGFDESTALCLIFDIAKKEDPDVIDQEKNNQFYLQFVTYYQHSSGGMRLRVTTLSRRWVTGLEKLQDLFSHFDQEAAVAVIGRLVSYSMETEVEFNPVRWLDRMQEQFSSRFEDYQKEKCSLLYPSQLSTFSRFLKYLKRSVFVELYNTSPDETAYYRMVMNRANVANSIAMIVPFLTPYYFDPGTEAKQSDGASTAANRILLLDSFFTIYVIHGSTISEWFTAGYQNEPEHKAFAEFLQVPIDAANTLAMRRFPVSHVVMCDQDSSQVRDLFSRIDPLNVGLDFLLGGGSWLIRHR